jgi:hypothetical protein
MSTAIDPAAVRAGRVRGRYFRENFAQGGFDLVQVLPELVTNADAAIAAGGRGHGRIELAVGPPDPTFLADWRRELRRLRVPAFPVWRYEVRCTDDGEGVDANVVERRLGALGVVPEQTTQRGLFGRGLRDVWLAQGGGRIEGVRGARAVESWFFPARGDDPFAYAHLRDDTDVESMRRALGVAASGSRVTVPLPDNRLPAARRLRNTVANLVQLRPVLEDPSRELWLVLPDRPAELIVFAPPEPDPALPVLFDDDVRITADVVARIVVRRAATAIAQTPQRALRRGGLLVRSGRAAHEVTLGSVENLPGARHLYGEVYCDAIEDLQRAALDSARPQLVVKADRTGLNEHHPLVQSLYAAIDRVLRPIVAAEERRAGANVVQAARAIRARDEVGLRELNDALRTAFDAPGSAGFARGGAASRHAPETNGGRSPNEPPEPARGHDSPAGDETPPADIAPMRFKQLLVRMHPGEQRSVSLLFDPERIPAGTRVTVLADTGLRLKLWDDTVPAANSRGWSRLTGTLRARATVRPGSQLTVLAEAATYSAELEVQIVRHHASGWVREIARKDEDAQIEAHFDPESGVVTVFEGRPEFRALARAARRAGLPRRRVQEYVPYRLLEVEAAANAVYQWAAERLLERRITGERPIDPAEYARAVYFEAQALRHRAHERLMRAFLDPEVFDGAVRLVEARVETRQATLLDS